MQPYSLVTFKVGKTIIGAFSSGKEFISENEARRYISSQKRQTGLKVFKVQITEI